MPSYMVELRRFTDRLRKINQRQNVELAAITDTSPHAKYGFVIARLVTQTPINVRTWSPLQLVAGQEIMVQRVNDKDSDWWVLAGVNGSTTSGDDGGIAFTPPVIDPTTVGPHALDGALHTGVLPWNRIDVSASKVDLGTDVQGLLPRANQESQIQKLTLEVAISAGDGATVTGAFAGCSSGLVRSVALMGGTAATLRFLVEPSGAAEYATTSVTTPYEDRALPFFHEDALIDGQFYYELTNDGIDPADFTLTVVVMAMG
jgi:hypothetical protein